MTTSSERVKRWRSSTKDRMVEAMGGCCQCCGYNATNSALAFHHLDPLIKESGFGDLRANPASWEKISTELKKCILVCHNCHSEIHAGVRSIPEVYAQFNTDYLDYRKLEDRDDCPMCGSSKPAKQKFCSHRCAQLNKQKVDWANIDLLALLKQYKISELEKMLGVSNAAIYKQRDKILKRG